MIQVEVEKNLICLEDICFGTGTVTQSRGNSTLTLTKINAANLTYDGVHTLEYKLNIVDAQYNYIIANLSDGFEYSTLIRQSSDNLIDVNGNIFVANTPSTASAAEATYEMKLWIKEISAVEHHFKRGTDVIAKFNPVTNETILDLDYPTIATNVLPHLALGTAAEKDAGTGAGEVLLLTEANKLPALDGSLLTNLPTQVGVPVGGVIMFGGTVAPANFLLCDGTAISRTTYATLFAVIGTSYGVGDGSTTFQLPDTRGEFIRGYDAGRGVDIGRVFGASQGEDIGTHVHGVGTLAVASGGAHTHTNGAHSGSGIATASFAATGGTTNLNTGSGGTHTHSLTGSVASAGGVEVRPRNVTFSHIIRYQ